MEPPDEDFAETRSSRADRDCTQDSGEMLCSMYAETEPAKKKLTFRTLRDYHTVAADAFKTNNKYRDYVMAQRQSSSTFSGGHLQTLDFSLSQNFPKHLQAPGLFHPGRSAAMPGPFSSTRVGRFSSLPKTNNQDGGLLPPPFMCQVPKHISAPQVWIAPNFALTKWFQLCIFLNTASKVLIFKYFFKNFPFRNGSSRQYFLISLLISCQ